MARKTLFPLQSLPLLVAASYGPDFLDKPTALIMNSQGRAWGHTLLALVLLTAAGLLLARLTRLQNKTVLAISALWLVHLACDGMNQYPGIIFWPLLGPMPKLPAMSILESIQNLYIDRTMPVTLAGELVLTLAALWLWRRKKPEASTNRCF